MSAKLDSMAESGQKMASQWEQAGESVNSAFGGISSSVTTAESSVDGVATSISSIQGAASGAASSANELADSANSFGDAATEAAAQADYWTSSVGNYDKSALEAIYSTEELVEMGLKSAEALEAEQAAMQQCESSAEELSRAIEEASTTENELSKTMEKASQVSEEIASNDKVSTETKEQLAKASQEAEEAMSELATAQQAAEQAMADYDSLLASGTNNLDELEAAAERASEATTELDSANARAANATEELSEATERAADEAENGGNKGKEAAEKLASALAAAGVTKLVSELANAFTEASEAAADFEVATMKISTIADTTKVSLGQISSDLMSLSEETGISVESLSDATYSALSASVDTASAVEFTATASKLAAGGFTSSATAVDVLTTALNAYGLEASSAESISDMLITTQNLGKTTVDELAASVGKVIPLASAYGVEMDNLSAAYAELTKGGIATAEAGTYLKSMLNELGDSGSTVSSVLMEQTGKSFSELMEQGYSLGDVMEVLGASVGGNAGAFNELWSSSEAGIGALSLYNAGAEQFNSTLDAMQSSVGATETAYKTMTDTTAHAQEELSNAADNLQISIGQSISPMFEKIYGLGTDILNGMSKFAQEHPVVVKAISAIGIGLGVAATAMVAVTFATTTAIPAVVSFGAALNAALGPIGWVAIGVTALVAAGAALISMFESAEDETAGMTATTREQYYELQDLNSEYEEACAKYGENSEEALRLKYQVDDLTAAFEANRQTVEEFTAEVDSLCESVSAVTDDFNSALTEINSQETGTLALIQKYEDLATQAELTGAQQKELEAVTKKLTDTYPDLAAQLDSTTASAEDYVDAMKKACEQEAEEQRQQQAQETYVDALAKRAELTEEIAKAQENVNLEQARMDDMSGWTHFWTAGEWDDLEAYQAALDELNAANAENEATIAEIEQGWADIADAEAEAADATVSWEDAATTAFEEVQDKVVELCEAYGEAYNAALESFEGQFGLFDEASMKSDDYLNATVDNAQAALDSQLAYWEEYNANLETLTSYGEGLTGEAKENYEALVEYAQSGSEEAAGLASSIADAIESGDEDAINSLASTLADVQSQQETAAAQVADFVTDFSGQMDELEKEMQDTVDNMNLDDEAAASAKATIQSYADAIRAGKGNAVAAAEEVANAVSAAFSAAKTTVSVNVSSSGSVAGHANGTTNAENAFIAGEEGPELIARPAAAYANGTTDSTDYFIAGENGPELIVGEQGSTVFPTEETDRIISALNGLESRNEQPLQILANTDTSDGRENASEQVKRILLEIAGSGAIEISGNGGSVDKESILEVLYDHLKPVLMNIIQGEIYEEGELSYEF